MVLNGTWHFYTGICQGVPKDVFPVPHAGRSMGLFGIPRSSWSCIKSLLWDIPGSFHLKMTENCAYSIVTNLINVFVLKADHWRVHPSPGYSILLVLINVLGVFQEMLQETLGDCDE